MTELIFIETRKKLYLQMHHCQEGSVSTHCFVYASLANDPLTRRSQNGILIFVNRAQILWHSKRQNTVETSTFGSEIVAMKNSIELIEGL